MYKYIYIYILINTNTCNYIRLTENVKAKHFLIRSAHQQGRIKSISMD